MPDGIWVNVLHIVQLLNRKWVTKPASSLCILLRQGECPGLLQAQVNRSKETDWMKPDSGKGQTHVHHL